MTTAQHTPGPDSIHIVPLAMSYIALNVCGRVVVVPVNVAAAAPA